MPEQAAERQAPILADSITKIGPEARGRVVVSGSHGGIYPAWAALTGGCRAVLLHDAGIGLESAGTAGLRWAEPLGFAIAAIDHRSAPIGRADLALANGVLSEANASARAVGVGPGMSCREAAEMLAAAPTPKIAVPEVGEARTVLRPDGSVRRLVLIDSASLVKPEDSGQIVVTGSHGALFGTDPANALRVDAAIALFNDAGGAATTRLPLLDQRGIAAATVAGSSARIGDARSTWRDGIISDCNAVAARMGIREGMTAEEAIGKAQAIRHVPV